MLDLIVYIIVFSVTALYVFKAELPMHYKVSVLSLSGNQTLIIELDSNKIKNRQLVTTCETLFSLCDTRALWQRPENPVLQQSLQLPYTRLSFPRSSASFPSHSPSSVTNNLGTTQRRYTCAIPPIPE